MNFEIQEHQLIKRVAILKALSIFSETEDSVLKAIAHHLTAITVPDGERVFMKGDTGRSMYIIVNGSVKVHDGHHIFTILGNEEVFGEFSLIDSQIRSASVTALEKTELLCLEQDVFFDIMAKNVDVTRGVLKSIVKRLYDKDQLEEQLAVRNTEILQQKEEIEAQRDEIEAQRNEIETQRDEVIRQRDQISYQQKEITSSIRYASRIQTAVLTPDDKINKLLPEYFILFRPRDIVSGDFYWVKEKDNKILVAVADCTGHGVPGAFMSMLGVAFLNEIGNTSSFIHPDKILNQLRQHIILALNQTGKQGEANDGMDIALALIDFDNMELQFAGANNPVWIVRNLRDAQRENPVIEEFKNIADNKITVIQDNNKHQNKHDSQTFTLTHTTAITLHESQPDYVLLEIKPDRMPISISVRKEKDFSNNVVKIVKGDAIYLFSDGFADQFGGKDCRKFYTKYFKELLLRLQNNPMALQKEFIENALIDWMAFPNPKNHGKSYDQIDDILVVGIKI